MSLSYPESIRFLYGLRLFGTKLGLESTRALAGLFGHPQQHLRFVHVAGTNGKGSTCAMLEGIWRAAGLRVGLFTSPHLVSFRERIQVNRQWIDRADIVRLVGEIQSKIDQLSPDRHPSFFEVVTVLALRYFADQHCDLVVWETGLGGRLDATNIVTPLASVITNIQFDHEQWLGNTLAQIASEKAGIIKPGVPVLTATEPGEALEVIRKTAVEAGAPLTHVVPADAAAQPLSTIRVPLLGEHQRVNAALALATVRSLGALFPVSESALQVGLEQVRWPGRFQLESLASGRSILLDGAHNPAGALALSNALNRHFPGRIPTLILGVLRDKDWSAMCHILVPVAGRVLLAPVMSERTAAPSDLEELSRQINPLISVAVCPTLADALERAEADSFVLITGSLHFIGDAMELLHLAESAPDERGLNEWDAAAASRQSATVESK